MTDKKIGYITIIREFFGKLIAIFTAVQDYSSLALDAFIFTKKRKISVRAAVIGSGMHVIIPIEKLGRSEGLLEKFSKQDREMISFVMQENGFFKPEAFMDGNNVKIAAKTFDRVKKSSSLKITVSGSDSNQIEFEADPCEIARNKFLLQLFDKCDAFNIGYAAAENRVRSEKIEINRLKAV